MNVSESNSLKATQSRIPEWAGPPLAATLAMLPFPISYGYAWKSACQLGTRMPSAKIIFLNGLKMAPTVGLIVSIQRWAEHTFKELLKKNYDQEISPITVACMSSLFGAVAAIYPISIVNGWTINKSMRNSIKDLSFKKSSAIVANEFCFLLVLKICELWGKKTHSSNDNPFSEYAGIAVYGVSGTVLGHPFDTMLTCWQGRKKITNYRILMRGIIPNAVTTACYTLAYFHIQKWLNLRIEQKIEIQKE